MLTSREVARHRGALPVPRNEHTFSEWVQQAVIQNSRFYALKLQITFSDTHLGSIGHELTLLEAAL